MFTFKKLSYFLALQFTAYVFILLLVGGTVYISADYVNLRQETDKQLLDKANRFITVASNPKTNLEDSPITKQDLLYLRLFDPSGGIRYAGGFFKDVLVPEVQINGLASSAKIYTETTVKGTVYRILTTPLYQNTFLVGYLQITAPEALTISELPKKIGLFALVSLMVSLITFLMSLLFARRTLLPVRQSMERLEQFTQDASHELKTPLSVLNSSLDLALKTKKYEEGIISAKADLSQAALLVDRLLELARLDRLSLQKSPLILSELVKEVLDKYQALPEAANRQFVSHIQAGIKVSGDLALVRQLISNLLSNAIKFTPEGGVITVNLNKQSLTVQDTGIGIDPELKKRIFERFYQADDSRSKEGFGLGLAIVQKIAELHGWQVKVASKVGNGSIFSLILS